MNTLKDINELVELVTPRLLQADSSDFQVDYKPDNGTICISLLFHYDFDPCQVYQNPQAILERIKKSMQDSPLYPALQKDTQKTIEDQATKIQQLSTKIEELTPFENYYKIQMNLNHGEKK